MKFVEIPGYCRLSFYQVKERHEIALQIIKGK